MLRHGFDDIEGGSSLEQLIYQVLAFISSSLTSKKLRVTILCHIFSNSLRPLNICFGNCFMYLSILSP